MCDHLLPHPSRLPSMGSHPRLPRPWVCASLELTARARRSSSSTRILPSRGLVCRFSHPCSRRSTLFARQDRYFFPFLFFHPLLPSFLRHVEATCSSLFCFLATISLRLPRGAVTLQHRPPGRL